MSKSKDTVRYTGTHVYLVNLLFFCFLFNRLELTLFSDDVLDIMFLHVTLASLSTSASPSMSLRLSSSMGRCFCRVFVFRSRVQKHRSGLSNNPRKHVFCLFGSNYIGVSFLRSSKNGVFLMRVKMHGEALPEIIEQTCFFLILRVVSRNDPS